MAEERPEGRCGLCGKTRPLAVSHAIPKGLYRLCRAEGEKNPHPIIVTPKFRMRSSNQMQDYFLCDECESRFDRQGEDWVMRHCYRGQGKFLLRDMLLKETPLFSDEGTSVYAGAEVKGLDIAALTYFPLSVFWRAAAREWNMRGAKMPPIQLGPYQEEISLFLLGKGDFPKNAALSVWVSTKVIPLLVAHFPMSERDENARVHRFYVPGIQFMLAIGKQLNESQTKGCIACGRVNPIWMSDHVETVIKKRFRDWLMKHEAKAKV